MSRYSFDMKPNQRNSHDPVFSPERDSNRARFYEQCRISIHKCLQKPKEMDLEELQKWHEEYNVAEARKLSPQAAVLQEVGTDQLDEDAIEKCIAELAEMIAVRNRFCYDCQDLFDNWPDLSDPESKDAYTDLNWPGTGADWKHAVARDCHTLILEAAARNKCRFCAFLVQGLKDSELLDTFRRVEARLEYVGDRSMASISVQNWGSNTNQLLWVDLPGKVCDHCNCGFAQYLKFDSALLETSGDTYDEEKDVLDIAKSWLVACSETHEICNKRNHDVLPTRLIFVAGDTPRLVLTAGWKVKPRYSTLSHRWGDEEFLKLTAENYNAFLTMIPTEELPRTFRDAIHITRHLGLEYLWVDSLCIIQGNAEDWRREASLMSHVYGGSFINIAAASAINVHQGCFLKSPNLVDGLRASILIRGDIFVRDFRNNSAYQLSTTESHLATRAWALQEKILPSRTIHFGDRGAFWECRTTTANEFLPDGFPRQICSRLLDEARKEWPQMWWLKVVKLYSAANLTYGNDKLPAMSGIARSIHSERRGQYLAGMWREEDVEAQLSWQVTEPRKRPTWRAPSWSWASIDGGVIYHPRQPEILQNTYAYVLDAKMALLGEDPFGEVRGGCLRIGCSGMLAARFSNQNTVKIEFDDKETNIDKAFPVSQDCLDDEWQNSGGIVYLMPLHGGRTGNSSGTGENDEERIYEMLVCGLILRSTDAAAGQFCRIGSFNFWKGRIHLGHPEPDEKEKEYYEPFLQAFEKRGGAVAQRVCAEVIENPEHPDVRYIISII